MARRTVLVSDLSGDVIEEGKGATVRVIPHDGRIAARQLDITQAEFERMFGDAPKVARRGRKPKAE